MEIFCEIKMRIVKSSVKPPINSFRQREFVLRSVCIEFRLLIVGFTKAPKIAFPKGRHPRGFR